MDISNTKSLVTFSVETTPKGVQTFMIYGDEVELVETGWTDKDGKQVYYEKYKLLKKTT